MNDKKWYEKAKEFFGAKENHTLVADAAKIGIWAVILLHLEEIVETLGLRKDAILASAGYAKQCARAKALWDKIRKGAKWAIATTLVGWLITAGILIAAKLLERPNWKKTALIGIAVELTFSLVTGAMVLIQQIRIHALVEVAMTAERLFGNAIAFIRKTLPSFFQGSLVEQKQHEESFVQQGMSLDKVRKTLWAIIWWLKVLELVLVDVICAGYRTFNTLVALLIIVNCAIAFVAYKNAYGLETKRFREWAFSYLTRSLAISFILVAIGAGTLQQLATISGVGRWLDARDAKAQLEITVEHSKEQILAERAAKAAADMESVASQIATLEETGMKRVLTATEHDDLVRLQARYAWNANGRKDIAPLLTPPPPPPVVVLPSCKDGADNDGDGYLDKDDYKCYVVDPNCNKKEKDDGTCRMRFGNYDSGKQITLNNDGKPPLVWLRLNQNGDEKKEPKWAKDRAAKEKTVADASGSPGTGGGKSPKADKQAAELDYIAKCFENPNCKL